MTRITLSFEVWTAVPLILVLCCYSSFCESYTSKLHLPASFIRPTNLKVDTPVSTVRCYAQKRKADFSVVGQTARKKKSEFAVVGEEDDDDDDTQDGNDEVDFRQRKIGGGDLLVVNEKPSEDVEDFYYEESHSASTSSNINNNVYNPNKNHYPEYSVLRPGTVVRVQVGDLSLARKAWKKRRRTGSPLLVPCSILNVDRRSAVRWNLIYLLEKFGRPSSKRQAGISMSLKDLALTYRTHLKSSMARQAQELGFESTRDMIKKLFNKSIQESYGVYFEEKEEEKENQQNDDDDVSETSTINMLYLTASTFRRKAQQRSANAPMLQFRPPREGDYDNTAVSDPIAGTADKDITADDTGTLTHTGWVRARKEDNNESGEEEAQPKLQREFTHLPLSACLRISQKEDVDTGRVHEGKILAAIVFDYDQNGDGGSPLLTLSLNAAGGARQRMKIVPEGRVKVLKGKPEHPFADLAVGDGPYRAKVVKLVGKKQRALVDVGVGRELSNSGGKTVQVLGTLRYQDSVELAEDDDDINQSDMFGEFDDEEDEDTEDLIAATIDELDMLDVNEDDDEDEEESYTDNIADELLSLRKSSSFEKGTFEDGEEEEDVSDMYEVDENGEIVMKAAADEEDEDDSEDEEDVDDDAAQNISESESGDEYISDISNNEMASLFTENEDGSITYTDPDTGETMDVSEGDEEFEGMMMMKSLIDDDLNKESVTPKEQSIKDKNEGKDQAAVVSNRKKKFRSKRLQVGEYIDVYVSSVTAQSNQFRVTTNPLIKGQKAKDVKKDEGITKKMNRLKKDGGLNRIYTLTGTECDGIVKAASKTGDWVYVQPQLENLPVGIGELDGDSEELKGLSAGDNVRVRISGIDEERGQLSMKVISKL